MIIPDKRKFIFKSFIVIFMALTNLYAQQIKFKHLTVENGLSYNVVNCMLEDHFGFLWFGTEDGLDRFDGYSFRVFRNIPGDTNSISDNDIWSLFEDSSGNIWAGTQNGILNCYNPESEKFQHYRLKNNELSGNSITCMHMDKKGFMWIGSYKGGLYRFNITTGECLNWQNKPGDNSSLSNKFVTTIYEDRENIWVGTYNGLCLLDKNSSQNSFKRFFHNANDKNSITDNIIWKILPSTDSNYVWIGTYNGLTFLHLTKKEFIQIIPDENNPEKFSRSVSSICEVGENNDKFLWAGTYDGLVKIILPAQPDLKKKYSNLKFSRWKNSESNPNSVNNNHINQILTDRSGVIWIAGEDGVDYYPAQKDKFKIPADFKYENVDFNKSNINNLQSICGLGNDIYLGTSSGLYFLKYFSNDYHLVKSGELSDQNIWSLNSGSRGDLWIGTYGNGLAHLIPGSGKIQKWKGNWFDSSDIGNSYVRSLYQDKSGNVWIGLWGVGLNRLKPQSGKIDRWHHEKDDPVSLSYDDVWVIYEDSYGRIWIGTYGGGLNLFNPEGEGSFYKWLSGSGKQPGLSNNNILSICESRFPESGNSTVLWIGTTNGLNKFVISNKNAPYKPDVKIDDFLSREEFLTRTINGIEEDKKGILWLTTNKGLAKFNPSTGRIENFTVFDGLQSNEFNPGAIYQSPSGEIYVGSIKGINIFNPDSIYSSDYKPAIVLTHFQIFNQDADVGPDAPLKSSLITAKNIILSYSQNVFSFQFASLDYNAPEMNQYAYMMEGFDKEWIFSGTRRFVTYTNLYPGTYTFKVKGTNSDGIWNETPAAIRIIITPPFWATWWFRSLFFLIIIGILYMIYRVRLLRMLDLERLRIKIASDLHDDIGSALTRISLESELLNSNLDPEGNRAGLNRIGTMSRDIITSMSDIVWSIDSRNDTMEDLINRMKDLSFSLFSLKNARIQFETDGVNLQRKLKVDIRQNIYLIFKEAINNAAKYSGSDQIIVSLKNLEGKFMMIITDYGSDFSPRKLTGHGLKNMQMRAERIGGKIEFIKENGLKIILTLKEL